jgi:23S rRNA pseudouridine2605 synthase
MEERIQKIISRAGIASRRHAEALMLAGAVTVNGKVVTELGSKADPATDHISVGGKLVHVPDTQSYYVLHKPHNVVATMSDPEGRPSLRGYVHGISGRIFPVGRLEFHASGLLLLMSDGELANNLLRGSDHIPQTYRLKLNTRLSDEAAKKVGIAAGAQIRLVKDAPNAWYEIELMDASRDRLRRALAEESVQVEKFMRVRLGGIDLGELPPGAYRSLSPEEIARLGRAAEGLLQVKKVPAQAAVPKRPTSARPKFPFRGRPGARPGTRSAAKPPWKGAHSSSDQQSRQAGRPQGRSSYRPSSPGGPKPPWKRAPFSPARPPSDRQPGQQAGEQGRPQDRPSYRPSSPGGPKPPWKRAPFSPARPPDDRQPFKQDGEQGRAQGRPSYRPSYPGGPKPPWKRAPLSPARPPDDRQPFKQDGEQGRGQGRPSYRPSSPGGPKPPWKRAPFSPARPPNDRQPGKQEGEQGRPQGRPSFRPAPPAGPKPPWKRKKFTRDQQTAARGPAKPSRRGKKPFRRDDKG